MKRTKWLAYLTFAITILYVIWRVFYTLPYSYGFLSMMVGCSLIIAELIGFLETYQIYQGSYQEPECPELIEEEYPEIDVLIATYNEPAELLKKTIHGCLGMEYPDKRKVHIYVCDDGSREDIALLAKKMKVGYLKREEHLYAKAGNYNHALAHTSAPLIATFDADMIPMSDFLMSMVPYFYLPYYEKIDGVWRKKENVTKEEIDSEKVGFVQSPQSFYNPDLFQYNLYSEQKVPNEQNYFFRQVQLTRNKNNTPIYGGSNTILSREALEAVGGFNTETITEDLATGLLIQSKGYRCYAISSVHASGLSPTEIDSLCKQRERWARGCIQTFRRLHVYRLKGLDRKQKRSYFYSLLYWFSPLRRAIFILAPILYTVFGIRVLECGLLELMIFWLPQILLYQSLLKSMNGEIRTSRLSNVYDTILFPYLLPAVLLETFGISNQVFHVTNKTQNKEAKERQTAFTKKYVMLFFILGLFTIIGGIRCINGMFYYGHIGFLVLLFWLIVNGYYIVMAIYFMLGRKAVRTSQRIWLNVPVELKAGGNILMGETIDLSEGGCAVRLENPSYLSPEESIELILKPEHQKSCRFQGKVVHVVKEKKGYRYAFSFTSMEEQEESRLYALLYDRVPVFPEKVSKKSGFFEDLQSNLLGRRKEIFYSNRKLPRIPIKEEFVLESKETVIATCFNYEYLVLQYDGALKSNHTAETSSMHKEEPFTLTYRKDKGLKIRVKSIRTYSVGTQEYLLCSIVHVKELMNQKNFQIFQSNLIEKELHRKEEIKVNKIQKEIIFQEMDFI